MIIIVGSKVWIISVFTGSLWYDLP